MKSPGGEQSATRFLVTRNISHLDWTAWGEDVHLEDEKGYIHSRYGSGPKFFSGYAFLWYEFRFALRLLKLFLKNHYAAMAVGRYGIIFPVLARLLRLRTRVVMTGVEFQPRFTNRLYGLALRTSDAICIFTSYESQALAAAYSIPRHRFHLVKHAFLPGDIFPATDEGYVVAGGVNGRDWKTFAEAVEGLQYNIKVFAKRLDAKLPANVSVSWVSREQFYRQVASASCLIVPLVREKLRCAGTTVWTAARAMGKVVIVTGVECACDYIEDGVTGFLVEHGNAAALRSRIKRIMEDAVLRRKVGEAARKQAWLEFSPEVYRSNILDVMKGPAAASIPPPSIPWTEKEQSLTIHAASPWLSRDHERRSEKAAGASKRQVP